MNLFAAYNIFTSIVFNKLDETTLCGSEIYHLVTCMRANGDGGCYSCIVDTFAAIQVNITFPALMESSLCQELHTCATEKCNPACGTEWSSLHTCAEEWADEHAIDVDICPDLGKLSSSSQEDPIVLRDFELPFNYTSTGAEQKVMSTC